MNVTLIPRRSRHVSGLNITHLEYADDLALCADTIRKAQKFPRTLKMLNILLDSQVSANKTEYMIININTNDRDPITNPLNG